MQYTIRDFYCAKRAKERKEIREMVCEKLGIKPQAFYKRLNGDYKDLSGAELLVWKIALKLDSVDVLFANH